MPTESAARRLLPHLRRAALARNADTGDAALLGEFVAARDEAAFATLVRRHGPMVLGVCRRVIGDPHLAEDAFQATFLVLARRAARVRPRHIVGHWLYGVAYRTALKARGVAARRMAKEKQVDAMPHPPVSPDEAWTDLQPVLDAELTRLPDKYRLPIVLCDLGGRTQRDVARELRLAPATLANRLAAARRLLAKRLTQRGVALSAGAVAAALGWHAATSAVPPTLAMSTVKAACAAAAGSAVGLPVPIVQLSDGVMRMFVLNKLKAVATGVVTCLALLAGLGLVAGPSLQAGPDEKPVKPAAPVKADSPKPADPRKPPPDDLVFLRRTSLDLRGTLPTRLEIHYFLADTDPKKRNKIVEWMLPEHGKQKTTAHCAVCHVVPDGWSGLLDNPHTGKLYHNNGHFKSPPGAAWMDLDGDGRLDLYVANGTNWLDELYDLSVRNAPKGNTPRNTSDSHQAVVDMAKANLAAAQAELEQVLKVSVGGRFPPGQDPADPARARVAQAQAQLDLAEAQLKQAIAQAAKDSNELRTQIDKASPKSSRVELERWLEVTRAEPSDADFLRHAVLDLTGSPPTTVEEKYFVADKDPKKREKLLGILLGKLDKPTARDKLVDELLADPEIQKRWTELMQQRLYAEQLRAAKEVWSKKPSDRLDRLLADLFDKKKSDEQVLNALCLATLARYPTETEQKLILEAVKAQPDRAAAWRRVLAALAATEEAKAHAAELGKRGGK
jgi:RNA polymerase sigma factor (sigma-70 family)